MTFKDIEKLLCDGRLNEAYRALLDLLASEPDCARGWYMLGGIYRRQQLWPEAIDAYSKAKMIEPDGPADAAIESIYDVVRDSGADLLDN